MSYHKSYHYDFKQEFSFQYRLQESSRVLSKYPDRIPVICEKSKNQFDLPEIDKKKYLVSYDLPIGQFMHIIRQRINLRPEQAIFLFVNNQIISGSSIIGQVYISNKDPDGFLYIQYAKENVFGNL